MSMVDRRRTLLEPGHEAEWARINGEEDERRRAAARAMTPAERVEIDQELSQQAFALLAASIEAGHAPRRALES
jgi:mannose/cellobiose epimerase-like protein (N-acyl-D-glucosamine 2-epimerase family)